jgi:hypothetical protein
MVQFLEYLQGPRVCDDSDASVFAMAKQIIVTQTQLSKGRKSTSVDSKCPVCTGDLAFDPRTPFSSLCPECGITFDRCCATFLPLTICPLQDASRDDFVVKCQTCSVFAWSFAEPAAATNNVGWTWFGAGRASVCLLCGMPLCVL